MLYLESLERAYCIQHVNIWMRTQLLPRSSPLPPLRYNNYERDSVYRCCKYAKNKLQHKVRAYNDNYYYFVADILLCQFYIVFMLLDVIGLVS